MLGLDFSRARDLTVEHNVSIALLKQYQQSQLEFTGRLHAHESWGGRWSLP